MVLCFCGRSLSATTYYVDSAKGKDSNSGTSSQSAWQTLARVNIAALLPGDAVLLASNGVWHEQLTVSHSGTAAAPITFSSYGGSQEPIIDGADVVTGWNLVGGNTYNAIYHAKAYKGFVDSLYEQAPSLQPVASLAQVKGKRPVLAACTSCLWAMMMC